MPPFVQVDLLYPGNASEILNFDNDEDYEAWLMTRTNST